MSRIYAIIDTETDGLHPERGDHLLEIAVRLVDVALETISEVHYVIHYPAEDVLSFRHHADQVVKDMHDHNGLWTECAEIGMGLNSVDLVVSQFLLSHITGDTQVRTVGNSLRLDLNMIEKYLPKTYKVLGYKSIDMSGVEDFLNYQAAVPVFEKKPAHLHRAMDDVDQCHQQMKWHAERTTYIDPVIYGIER